MVRQLIRERGMLFECFSNVVFVLVQGSILFLFFCNFFFLIFIFIFAFCCCGKVITPAIKTCVEFQWEYDVVVKWQTMQVVLVLFWLLCFVMFFLLCFTVFLNIVVFCLWYPFDSELSSTNSNDSSTSGKRSFSELSVAMYVIYIP